MPQSPRRLIASALLAFSLGAACLPVAAAGPTANRTLDEAIKSGFGVSSYSLVRLEPPVTPEEGFELTLPLGGASYTINFIPREMHTEHCVMSLDLGGPELVDVAPPPAGIYEGVVVGGPGTAVAQVLGSRMSVLILLPDATWMVQPITDIIPGAEPGLHVVVASEHLLGDGHHCGLDTSGHSAGIDPGGAHGASPEGNPLLCEVAVESDYQFTELHALNASDTAQDIARVMAWSSKFFTEGGNVKFKITRYVIRLNPATNPYSSSEPGVLLGQFEAHWNQKFQTTQRDTAHLFTGRDLNGSTIGIARLGVICSLNAAYGLSQSLWSAKLGKRAAVTAHEIGHNFNQNHCDAAGSLCAPCAIMLAASGIGPAQLLTFGCTGPFIAFYAQSRPCLEPTEGVGGPCRADLNFDGRLTVQDFGAFQTYFTQGLATLADFNHDGQLTGADFGAFQNAFTVGCP